MAAPDRIEVATALYGAWRLIRGDAGGSAYFRAGRDGFWSAAWAVVLVIPAHLLTMAFGLTEYTDASFGLTDFVREGEVLVIRWFGFALLTFYILQNAGRLSRFDGFMTAYFWTSVPLFYAEALLSLVSAVGLLPAILMKLGAIAVLGVMFWVQWFVARMGLGVTAGEAGFVVIGSVAFHWIVSKVLSPLL